MTKRLFVMSGILFAAIAAMFIGGIAGNAPALLMLSLVCVTPIFFMALGAAFGRASNEFTIARKAQVNKSIPANRTVQSGRVVTQEPLN